ncbi:hypothetical protein [Photobacterium sp. OFAV2-7]|uniref:hypothetical protein n=1 Tax=Photobacterium sp. OFAV2-7 TaxID=2917748 RepID=UPI001EF61CE1|nr:hypothetical protein [Photobacterium sp. OFAV2-7]MCG7588283.1 hypothetical protein [Photobacterium sp. OFAV2-7]
MKTIPMIFNQEMIKALLDGRKTVTRRPLKVQPSDFDTYDGIALLYDEQGNECVIGQKPFVPPGNRDDLIWVRETWQGPLFAAEDWSAYKENKQPFKNPKYCHYRANGDSCEFVDMDTEDTVYRWRPSIHMPRWASRLTLRITDIRAERVQDITEEQAKDEGMLTNDEFPTFYSTAFCGLWESLYSNWSDNPWVWVIEFEVIHQNIDSYIEQQEAA